MANLTVRTSPPGVWPAETTLVDEAVYAVVEADVLRRKPGELVEGVDRRDQLDNAERATHHHPLITMKLLDTEAEDGETDVEFEIEFDGDPAPEVNWYITRSSTPRRQLAHGTGGVTIATDSDSSLLTLASVDIETDDEAIIDVEVRNYKGTATDSAVLTVVDGESGA